MNIFVLDLDPSKCAEYHCDKHLVKMITEHNQILGSIAYTARGISRKKDITPEFINKHFQGFPRKNEDGTVKPYGIGFIHHPCTVWSRVSFHNYMWLCKLTIYMCKEYTKRYNKVHAGESICHWYYTNPPELPNIGPTPFAQAMPETCKDIDPVKAYRDYYVKFKTKFAKWNHSETPEWFTEGVSRHTVSEEAIILS